jgi:hypothetical protein
MQHDRFGSQISVKLVCLSTAHIQRFYPLPIAHTILKNEALVARTLITEGYLLRAALFYDPTSYGVSGTEASSFSNSRRQRGSSL